MRRMVPAPTSTRRPATGPETASRITSMLNVPAYNVSRFLSITAPRDLSKVFRHRIFGHSSRRFRQDPYFHRPRTRLRQYYRPPVQGLSRPGARGDLPHELEIHW